MEYRADITSLMLFDINWPFLVDPDNLDICRFKNGPVLNNLHLLDNHLSGVNVSYGFSLEWFIWFQAFSFVEPS